MESKNGKIRDDEIQELLSGMVDKLPQEQYDVYFKSLQEGYDLRNTLFETAGIDKNIIEKLEKEVAKDDFSLESICRLVAPELRKAFSVEPDPESSPGEFKLRKSDHNLFDDLGMSDEKLADFLITFARCYRDDTDEDWRRLSRIMLDNLDKFFAPAYEKAREAGLLEDQEEKKTGE